MLSFKSTNASFLCIYFCHQLYDGKVDKRLRILNTDLMSASVLHCLPVSKTGENSQVVRLSSNIILCNIWMANSEQDLFTTPSFEFAVGQRACRGQRTFRNRRRTFRNRQRTFRTRKRIFRTRRGTFRTRRRTKGREKRGGEFFKTGKWNTPKRSNVQAQRGGNFLRQRGFTNWTMTCPHTIEKLGNMQSSIRWYLTTNPSHLHWPRQLPSSNKPKMVNAPERLNQVFLLKTFV